MSGHNGRTAPFPGFSRGLPIIGQAKPGAPLPGAYFYQVPVLIRRKGQPLDADSFEVQLPMPINGVHFRQLEK